MPAGEGPRTSGKARVQKKQFRREKKDGGSGRQPSWRSRPLWERTTRLKKGRESIPWNSDCGKKLTGSMWGGGDIFPTQGRLRRPQTFLKFGSSDPGEQRLRMAWAIARIWKGGNPGKNTKYCSRKPASPQGGRKRDHIRGTGNQEERTDHLVMAKIP